jgi:tetratricopeptide (TPR) repeat protein
MKTGIELHDAGKYEEAIQQFESALKKEPKNTFPHYEMANTYINLQKYDKAIKHADKVIDANDKNLAGAYMLKGTAYDLLQKPKKAIEVYKKGIEAMPDFYLLHYNLGITEAGIKEYDNAEIAFIQALTLKPTHASSHYALGVVQWEKGRKVKTLLALYNFILLESNTKRAVNALKIIDDVIDKTAKKQKNGFDMTITFNSNTGDDSFRGADLLLGLSRAMILGENKGKLDSLGIKSSPALNGFIQTNEYLFKYLGKPKVKGAENDFWWRFYAVFFADMEKAGFTEALSYYIRTPFNAAEVQKWMKDNQATLKQWNEWTRKYERKM